MAVFSGQVPEDRRRAPADRAPFGPEIHKNVRLFAQSQNLVPIRGLDHCSNLCLLSRCRNTHLWWSSTRDHVWSKADTRRCKHWGLRTLFIQMVYRNLCSKFWFRHFTLISWITSPFETEDWQIYAWFSMWNNPCHAFNVISWAFRQKSSWIPSRLGSMCSHCGISSLGLDWDWHFKPGSSLNCYRFHNAYRNFI